MAFTLESSPSMKTESAAKECLEEDQVEVGFGEALRVKEEFLPAERVGSGEGIFEKRFATKDFGKEIGGAEFLDRRIKDDWMRVEQ